MSKPKRARVSKSDEGEGVELIRLLCDDIRILRAAIPAIEARLTALEAARVPVYVVPGPDTIAPLPTMPEYKPWACVRCGQGPGHNVSVFNRGHDGQGEMWCTRCLPVHVDVSAGAVPPAAVVNASAPPEVQG